MQEDRSFLRASILESFVVGSSLCLRSLCVVSLPCVVCLFVPSFFFEPITVIVFCRRFRLAGCIRVPIIPHRSTFYFRTSNSIPATCGIRTAVVCSPYKVIRPKSAGNNPNEFITKISNLSNPSPQILFLLSPAGAHTNNQRNTTRTPYTVNTKAKQIVHTGEREENVIHHWCGSGASSFVCPGSK